MSGSEADVSADGTSSESENEAGPLPLSPVRQGTDEPFNVVLKGGSPWGFTLKGGTEDKTPLQVEKVEGGKAAISEDLKVGDYVLGINDVRCRSWAEADQLIQTAFRTLTLQVWRATNEPVTSPVRSPSFVQKARELQERAERARQDRVAVQDDSIVFAESKGATSFRMKPRQRRIESFHGRRPAAQTGGGQSPQTQPISRPSPQPRQSPQGPPVSRQSPQGPPVSRQSPQPQPAPRPSQRGLSPQPRADQTPHASSTSGTSGTEIVAKPGLKGWATEKDLTTQRQPIIMSSTGNHVTSPTSRHAQLSAAKSSPVLNQDDIANSIATPRDYVPKPKPRLDMTKSTPDIPDTANYENVSSPTSPKSPSWYQQRFPNRAVPVFDFSAPMMRRSAGSPRNSYVGGSPRNSYAGYSPVYSQSPNYPQSTGSGGYSQSSNGSAFSQSSSNMDTSYQRNSGNYSQPYNSGNTTSFDDTPHRQQKSYDRRSLPPQLLQQQVHEFQKDSIKPEPSKALTSMPTTREEEEIDPELASIKPRPPNDLDLRPMYSPPAPPVRDISSLKYVGFNKNHEKYPSWPVTTGQPPPNLGGPPIDAHLGDNVNKGQSDKSEGDKSQLAELSDKNSPGLERKGSDESKQPRNQSDPGFKQKPKKSFYTTRKPKFEPPKENNYENMKTEEERFNEFYDNSKPGYPPPKLDPDGHNYGDEKYNIPSPPERDVPNLDEKSLVQKIAAVIAPNSQQNSYQFHQYNVNSYDNSSSRFHKTDMATSPMQSPQTSKVAGMYFQQAMNAQNLLHTPNGTSQTSNMVDCGTSPLSSPNDEKEKGMLRTISANTRSDSIQLPLSAEKIRGLIIRQMPYYNTSTQTEHSADSQSGAGPVSQTSVNTDSESEHRKRMSQETNSDSQLSQPLSVSTTRSEVSSSSHSSGIGSMSFSDHSSAPMLRKLSEEFYRGRLSGSVPNEKRFSSASSYDDPKSPRAESIYSGNLTQAESYSSVIIHPHEPSGPFGSNPSLTSSKHDLSDVEFETSADQRHSQFKPRYSIDSNIFHKSTTSMSSMPPRSLQESRFTSENNISSANNTPRNYSQSMLQLSRPPSSLAENTQGRSSAYSSESSTSSRPHGSMEARSSGSRYGSDSSTTGIPSTKPHPPTDSDSVFFDKSSPLPSDSQRPQSLQNKFTENSVSVGRKESMKHAYGTYDANEHHYATPYGHQRNSSEVLSPNARDPDIAHGRSSSNTDYMPMHYIQSPGVNRLGEIKEEGSEVRWQEAVRKSKSLGPDMGNYMNVEINKEEVTLPKGSDSDRSDTEKKKEIPPGIKQTGSEPPRTRRHKDKRSADSAAAKSASDQSSSGESSKGNKSDGESIPLSVAQHLSESELKKLQQKAVLDFVERKTKRRSGSDSSEGHQSPITKENAPEFPSAANKPPLSPASPTSPSPTMLEFTRKYNYTKAQRAESLRRTRSITSNSPRESSDYMDMKRPERHYETEWSRLRSRRPLSIGSDISAGGESYAISPVSPIATPEQERGHIRPVSEASTGPSQAPTTSADEPKPVDSAASQKASPSVSCNDSMVTSPVYHNLGEYPRRPPPPVPGGTEEKPPALPPRSTRFPNSKSESFLLRNLTQQQSDEIRETARQQGVVPQQKWENSPQEDNYAEQLRKQARRFSEQHHKPMAMQVVSSKSQMQVSVIQSYKQEPIQPLEAKPLQQLSSSSSTPSLKTKPDLLSSPPLQRESPSPEPPPMPTPLKNGDLEIKVDLNVTADFPPPPAEFTADGDKTEDTSEDRCADDSYGSYKTRTPAREVGKYKRTVSDSNVLRSNQDMKLRQCQDLNHSDISGRSSPSKPPRKKLEQDRDSPTSQRSNSPLVITEPIQPTEQTPKSQVPSFNATETSPGQVQKSVAKPLQSAVTQNTQKSSSATHSSSGSFVSTVVQRPNSAERRSSTSEQQDTVPSACSVKDRIKNIEVISYSPGTANGHAPQVVSHIDGVKHAFEHDTKSEGRTPRTTSESLENLESSIKSSNSFRDRLRPVVRKIASSDKPPEVSQPSYVNRTNEHVNERLQSEQVPERPGQERVNERLGNSTRTEGTPPQLPSRTYKQSDGGNVSGGHDRPPRPSSKPAESASQPPYRRNSFQLQNSAVVHPRPYENKQSGANIQNPMTNRYTNSQSGQHQESQRSPKQSIPEPQVPSRTQQNVPLPSSSRENVTRRRSRDMPLDQNKNVPSPDQRLRAPQLSPNISDNRNRSSDHTQSNSVHIGDKRKSDSSSTQYNEKRDNSVRPELRGDSSSDQRQKSSQSDRYSSGQQSTAPSVTSYHSGDYKHWRSGSNISVQSDNQSSNSSNRQEPQSNHRTKEQSYNVRNFSENESVQNRTKQVVPPVTILHERQPSKEELECDLKAKELAKVLSESDKKLSEVLISDSNKSRMQYMDGLFPVSNEPVERPRPRPVKKTLSKDGVTEVKEPANENEPTSPLPSNYYVSPPKAMIELEIRKIGDTSKLTQDIGDDDSLAQKKEELLQRMVLKVEILKEDKMELITDMQENTQLGQQITVVVEKKCRLQQDKDKFKSYIEDMEKIIRLLLKLSGLLARAENTIQGLTEATNEKIKKLTFDKRDRLHKQHEDAKELKADIDRRSAHVEQTLRDCLAPAELNEYHIFIKMKSKYTIQHQELEDKITLGQEQIAALQKSIPTRK